MFGPKFYTGSQVWSTKGKNWVSTSYGKSWFDVSSSLQKPSTGRREKPKMSSLNWGGLHDPKHALLIFQHEPSAWQELKIPPPQSWLIRITPH